MHSSLLQSCMRSSNTRTPGLHVGGNKYIYLAKPKSGAPGLFILTGCRISENKRLWNCQPFGFPRYCLIMPFSSLPN